MVKKQKDKNRQKLVLSLIIIALMVLSAAGYMSSDFFSSNENTDYKGKPIYNINSKWVVKQGEENIVFDYHPSELEDLTLDDSALNLIKNAQLFYMTFDPNDESYDQVDLQYIELFRFDVENNFPTYFQIYSSSGTVSENENYKLPIITCANATQLVPVIELKRADTNLTITNDGACISVEARTGQDFIRFKDKLEYSLLGYS